MFVSIYRFDISFDTVLELAVLGLLHDGPRHGYELKQRCSEIIGPLWGVSFGSLYPALQRLLLRGWVKAEWKMSETNRRARFYTLTAAGRKQLGIEISEYERMIAAIGRVLQNA